MNGTVRPVSASVWLDDVSTERHKCAYRAPRFVAECPRSSQRPMRRSWSWSSATPRRRTRRSPSRSSVLDKVQWAEHLVSEIRRSPPGFHEGVEGLPVVDLDKETTHPHGDLPMTRTGRSVAAMTMMS